MWARIKARLLFLAIGLGMGLLVAAVVGYGYNTRIEELEVIRTTQRRLYLNLHLTPNKNNAIMYVGNISLHK